MGPHPHHCVLKVPVNARPGLAPGPAAGPDPAIRPGGGPPARSDHPPPSDPMIMAAPRPGPDGSPARPGARRAVRTCRRVTDRRRLRGLDSGSHGHWHGPPPPGTVGTGESGESHCDSERPGTVPYPAYGTGVPASRSTVVRYGPGLRTVPYRRYGSTRASAARHWRPAAARATVTVMMARALRHTHRHVAVPGTRRPSPPRGGGDRVRRRDSDPGGPVIGLLTSLG